MTYNLNLKSSEPCDVYIAARNQNLVALVTEANARYAVSLGTTDSADFTVMCDNHAFTRQALSVVAVNDLVLVDGVACYATDIDLEGEKVICDELSRN